MNASLTQHLHKELRRPVRNTVRVREVRSPVDHYEEPHNCTNAAKISDGSFQHAQHFNCYLARGELALIHANLITNLPAEELAPLLSKAPGEINLVT